ncbi:MAG: RNA methyltransferase [Clostridia bacterium]|nr:RNA methyltransferase [Clostridia bacterium]
MILTSKNNPLIKETAALKEKKARKEQGMFLVEGWKMAIECQKSDFETDRVFVAESYLGELPFAEEKIVRVSDEVFRHLSDEKTPQGVLCRVRIPVRPLLPPKKRCLLLDGVADPGNMGAIIRTANAAGYEEVYLTEECADPYSPKSVRASMSGVFFTKIYRAKRTEILSVLKDIPIVVADMGGVNLFSFTPPTQFALAIGNEANGISQEVFNASAHTVKIPMRETQESLNAAISAGIIMYFLSKDTFNE